MQYNKLGTTDKDVSAIVMGCWGIGGGYTWGEQDEKESIKTITTAVDLGINLFDTAEFYSDGYSEEVVGKGLRGLRDKVMIATKVWVDNLTKDKVIAACEGSLKRLQTDYIDLYQIHWPNRDVPVEETLEAMDKLKRDGKIRSVGVSNFGVKDLQKALAAGNVVTNQMAYSLLFRALEYEILQKSITSDVAVLAYSPLAQGLLTGKFNSPEDVDDERARQRFYSKHRSGTVHDENGYEEAVFEAIAKIQTICDDIEAPMTQVALAWVLRQPGIKAVLAGARHPDQIIMNAKAAEFVLSVDVLEKLNAATETLKMQMGPNADPWRTASRIQ
jgi:aryl-alcohol dehydrogenase-like predicted oxidoreductase